jgi:hypothetical protein
MDAAANTAVSLIDTTKAPMYFRRTLRMRAADVCGTMPDTYPHFRMWHSWM